MQGFRHSVEVAAPPERVWEVLTDVARWPERIPTVDAAELLDPPPLAVGSRARLRQPRLPEAEWTVTELVEGTSFTWSSPSPGVTVTASHAVSPVPAGTRLDLSVTVTGALAPLGWLMTRSLTRRYVETEAASLKRAAEEA
jgi:carbon monoxide dehydrogenase subunit G